MLQLQKNLTRDTVYDDQGTVSDSQSCSDL